MTELNLQELEENIHRRLAAVDVTSNNVNRPVVERAFASYFNALKREPRRITWAQDAKDAHRLVAKSDPLLAEHELHARIDQARSELVRLEEVWTDARDTVKALGHGVQLERVRDLMRGHSVILSVPWRFYEGRLTGDRGRRTSPTQSPVWQSAGDALENAARAAAECAWARYMRAGLVLTETARLAPQRDTFPSYEQVWLPFLEAFEAGLWLFWITSTEVIALPRPRLQLHVDQIHAANGPAVSWPAGDEHYFFLNGVQVTKEIVETPARELDPHLLLKERNSEVRREIVRKIGIERVCEELATESLDRQGNYELLLLDLGDYRTRPFLKMRNPSIGVYHIEGVAPECRTVAEALAWRNQTDVPPSVLT